MARYTDEEKKDMYDVYIKCRRNELQAAQAYFELYPERLQPSSRIFSRI